MNNLFPIQSTFGAAFLTYQFKVALILACFYLFYRLLMSRETFHKLNRFLLLGMLAVSFVLPFCVFTIHRYVPQLTEPAAVSDPGPRAFAMPLVPESDMAVPAAMDLEPEFAEAAPAADSVSIPEQSGEKAPFDWLMVALAVWFAGCVFHLSRTILSVIQVKRLTRTARKVITDGKTVIYVVDMNVSPFSWMNSIVMSGPDYESCNRRVILDHEKTHIRLGHSYDLLLVDILSSIQWFNPVTAMLRKDLQDIHEFQADGCVIRDGFDAKEYQYMLLGKVASMSGYSITNHFKKQNLSNRIKMMNRKDSKFARAFKALYAPVLMGLVIVSFAVTVYDCKPDTQSKTSAGSKRNVDVLRDSMQILDEIYGQGKFNRFPWETGAVWLTDGDEVLVRTGDRVEATMKMDEVADYLLDYKGFNTHRITIVLSKLEDKFLANTGLLKARPLVDMLNEVGIYAVVVRTDAEWMEAYYSTYKYGRIYTWSRKGLYELDYNGMVVQGTPKELVDWIKALDIEYLAFYPDDKMPWSDASIMMKAAYERGSRTFSICLCESNGGRSVLADLLDGPIDNGTLSRSLKEDGYYLTTVLPTKRDLDKEFKGKTVMEVERAIRAEYTDKYLDNAVKTVHNPQIYSTNSSGTLTDIAFGEKETALILNYTGLARNVWSRPGDFTTSKIIADGKEYACIGEFGLQNFADYPFVPEYEYANGSFCWVPDRGRHITTYIFEPLPADVKKFDLVEIDKETGRKEYWMRGVNVSGQENLFDGITLVSAYAERDLAIPGTTNRNSVEVERIEITPDETTVFFNMLVRADFSFKGRLGSDMTLVLNDGSKLGIKSANYPLDQDFDRGGDHMINYMQLVFPTVDLNKLLPDPEKGKFTTLKGTVCGQEFELPLMNMRVVNK